MLRNPTFLGFSMAERNHRRALVVGTYFVLSALMTAIAAATGDVALVAWAWIVVAWNVASGAILGRLVTNTSIPQNIRFGPLLDLGLAAKPREPDAMDERDVAVRNAACFKAYRAIGMYVFLLALLVPGIKHIATVRTFEVLLAPLLAMAVTLPQAIVLWTEPDIPLEPQA